MFVFVEKHHKFKSRTSETEVERVPPLRFFCKNGVHERRDIDRDIKETLLTLIETLEDPCLLNTRLVQNVEGIKIKTV